MLGRTTYTREELDNARSAVERQVAAYRKLSPSGDVEAVYFNNMTLVLDRYFVHRLRGLTGKDSNSLNEVEMICDSLINNDGVLKANSVIKYVPDQTVVRLKIGDTIQLTADQFERLSSAFLADLERKFVE